MKTIVQKYGGTSVGSIERIQNVARRVIEKKEQGYRMVVVVSAMGKRTDELVKMAYEINPHPPKREMDMLLSTGEQVSIAILTMALDSMGYDAISFTGHQIGIRTMGHHGKSKIIDIDPTKIDQALDDGKIVIVAGFQGVNEKDDITTLGRGGSDTSAVALSCVLGCPCEIYTDVDGIYGVDPRLYADAKKLDYVSFDEMLDMASLGAGIMHTRAIELGSKYNAEIYVASSINDVPGTLIRKGRGEAEKEITGMAVDRSELMISIKNVPHETNVTAKLFSSLAQKSVNVDMISQTSPVDGHINISFSAPIEEINALRSTIRDFRTEYPLIEVDINEDVTKLSVVGIGMKNHHGVASKYFSVLGHLDFPILMITTSEIRISCMIPTSAEQRAVEAVAKAFDL